MTIRQRELDRAKRQLARAADRDRLAAIKAKLREVKRSRPDRLRAIRTYCRTGRENARQAIARLRAEVRAELAARVQALRDAQRGDCLATRERVRSELDQRIVSAARELDEQRTHMKREYGRKPRGARATARELRQESDDEVRRNLPPELVTVFDAVRRRILPEKRRTRTETFLEWVEANQDEAHEIIYRDVDRAVARLVEEQRAIERRRARGYRDPEAALAALESAVPF